MADSLVNIYAKEFSDNIMLLSRQGASKMMAQVMLKTGITGNKFTQERIGTWAVTAKTQGVQDTPQNDPGMSRRTATMTTFNDARQAARDDDLKTKVAVSSPWVKAATSAWGNRIDLIVYNALIGDAYSGIDGTVAVALPAAQKLAYTGTLTTDMCIDVKAKLDGADVPEMGRKCMIHPDDLNGLLSDTKVQDSDYNTIKALVRGEINTWLGFEFIMTTNAAAGVPVFFQEDALCLGLNESPYVDIRIRHDLSDAQEIYYELNAGATRLEDERVVEVTLTAA